MTSLATSHDEASSAQRSGSSRLRRRLRLTPQWVRTHRWVSLLLGLALLVETTSGALLLMRPDIERWMHPERFHVTASAHPMSPADALAQVQRDHPGFDAVAVYRYRGILRVEDSDYAKAYWIDPGTGRVNAHGNEEPYVFRMLENVHECGFTCQGYPLYASWLTKPLPWSTVTWGDFLLGSLGVVLAFLCLSGIVIWWPGVRRMASGFTVRRGRGAYVRDLDLHKVVGIIALPMLLMWGFTGAAYEFRWPVTAYYWLLPGSHPADPPAAAAGTGLEISMAEALQVATALHPHGQLTSLSASTPDDKGGSYSFSFADGVDEYKDFDYPGNTYVTVDSHGGGVQDYRHDTGPLTERLWENFYDGSHRGTYLPWIPRLFWLAFGLAPVLLGFTGITIWLTKRRSRRNRAAAARARTA